MSDEKNEELEIEEIPATDGELEDVAGGGACVGCYGSCMTCNSCRGVLSN